MDPLLNTLLQLLQGGGLLVVVYGFLRYLAPRLLEDFRRALQQVLTESRKRERRARRREHRQTIARLDQLGVDAAAIRERLGEKPLCLFDPDNDPKGA